MLGWILAIALAVLFYRHLKVKGELGEVKAEAERLRNELMKHLHL